MLVLGVFWNPARHSEEDVPFGGIQQTPALLAGHLLLTSPRPANERAGESSTPVGSVPFPLPALPLLPPLYFH